MQGSTQEEVRIDVGQLKLGMYVSRLDRPWEDSPFTLQGMWMESVADIEKVQRCCRYVYVDKNLSDSLTDMDQETASGPPPPHVSGPIPVVGEPHSQRRMDDWTPPARDEQGAPLPGAGGVIRYEDEASVTEELPDARIAVVNLEATVAFAMETIAEKESINLRAITEAVKELVASILRNPDPAIGFAIGRKQDNYTLRHCVNMAIWCICLGRQLGLPRSDLALLGTGATLCDLGRAKLPHSLLGQPKKLSSWEIEVVREHVNFSLELLDEHVDVDPVIRRMVAQHHEHINGSGYPNAVAGEDIDLYARIARIIDTFEALISTGPHRRPITVSRATKELYSLRDQQFQKDLVEAFISAIGIYPAGTSVQLSSREAGIVVAGARRNHLKPVIWRLTDADGFQLARPNAVNLAKDDQQRQIKRDFVDGELGFSARAFFC
ncbi:MAG: DUF3391 domain-containing protein [Xanthomonadales bacterium]|nr:DUF3391 domain-containing protein [Xanthomonadales bacterium]